VTVADIIRAPWTQEVADALNAFQRAGRFHPFTCGSGNRGNEFHAAAIANYGLNDAGQLHATLNGWICMGCGYTQDWAFTFMVEAAGARPIWERQWTNDSK
jgi:hypothetical protein